MKKHLFFNNFYFLLTIVAIFMFASCNFQKSEKEIRAEVEKEIMLKVDSLLQTPKNVLSASDTRFVAEQFSNIKIQAGVETTVCTLKNGTIISFLLDKDFKYNLFAQFDGKKENAVMAAYLPVVYDNLFATKINDCVFSPVGCGFNPPFKKLQEICIETSMPDLSCRAECVNKCQGSDDLNRALCEGYCVFKNCPPIKTKLCWRVVVP